MDKIVLITTSPAAYGAGNDELSKRLDEKGFRPILVENLEPPFAFDAEAVFGLVVGVQTKCTDAMMAHFPNLKIISPFGIGVDHIDLAAAKNRGIVVTNAPVLSGSSVAELALAFILALARKVISFDKSMKEGKWERLYGSNLFNKRLGIVGIGSIGKEVAKLALAFGMQVSAFDIYYDEKFLASYPVEKKDFDSILRESDYITIHVPSNVETKSLFDERAFSLLKDGVSIINTARGDIINISAFLSALDSGKVAGAALDVFPKEPPTGDPELERLIKHPKVIATPHIAAVCPEVHQAIAARIFNNVLAVSEGRLEEIDKAG